MSDAGDRVPAWRRYLRFLGPNADADVEDELRTHLELRIEDNLARGLDPAEARREALERFGNLERVRAECKAIGHQRERSMRRTELFGALRQDGRYAARTLARSPGFAAVAILSLALGIGANTAIFAVVDGVLLRPLPYREPDALLSVWSGRVHSMAELARLRESSRAFVELAGYTQNRGFSLTGAGEPGRLTGAYATANLPAILGVAPAIGAGFRAEHEQPASPRAAMLSDALWRTRFGGDPAVVGRAIELDGVPHTIVGVMPRTFRFPSAGTELWVAATFDEANAGDFWGWSRFSIIGRTREAVSIPTARAELETIAEQIRLENPLWRPAEGYTAGIEIVPLHEDLVGDVRGLLLILLASTTAVLLIACVNVANLSLSRALGRAHELAIRTALGAGRGRLTRQLLAESLVLALLGGAAGLLVARGGLDLLRVFLPVDTPRLATVALDPRVVTFALLLSMVTGILFGLLPALRTAAVAPASALGEGARGSGMGAAQRRLSAALVMAEVALAVMLVAGAALLLQSFWRLRGVDPGFRVAQVVTARLDPMATRYGEAVRRVALWDELTSRIAALPSVSAVGATTELPLRGRSGLMATRVDGAEQDPGNLPMMYYHVITPGYLRAMGIPVVRGRGLTAADRAGTRDVVLVNEAMVRRYWPDEDPIGQRIGYPWPSDWLTVVGVVRDTRDGGLARDIEPAIYRPFHQAPEAAMSLVVRFEERAGGGNRAVLAPWLERVRAIVADLDASIPVSDVRTMQQRLADDLARPRVTAALLLAFASVALALGAIGIYGVIAYAVGRRTREIGVRMALGARQADVLAMVLRDGVVLAVGGIVLGVVGALATTRVLRGMLFGVEPGDPVTLAVVSVILVMVAVAASLVPARRAAQIDPILALRSD